MLWWMPPEADPTSPGTREAREIREPYAPDLVKPVADTVYPTDGRRNRHRPPVHRVFR